MLKREGIFRYLFLILCTSTLKREGIFRYLFLILCITFLVARMNTKCLHCLRYTTVGQTTTIVLVHYIADGGNSFNVAVISELPDRGTARRCITFCTFTDGGMHLSAIIP